MFKIDWPCAIGGTILGYYAKGRVTAAKETVKKISCDAIASLKESFSDDYEKPQAPQGTQGNGQSNGGTV